MFISRALYRITLAAVSLLVSTSSFATSLEKMNFDGMVHEATACVIAQAISSESLKVNGEVVTRTQFKVDNVAFGQASNIITVVTPGGRFKSGKIPMVEVTAGAPTFLNGEKKMLLLKRASARDDFRVVGMNQGLFSVAKSGNETTVRLPQSEGGAMSVDSAVRKLRSAKTGDR